MSDTLDPIIVRARRLLTLEANDFAWSGWEDAGEAVAELDQCYADLLADGPEAALKLSVLFATTGPTCETSLSSGWGSEYVSLGNDFDRALRAWLKARGR